MIIATNLPSPSYVAVSCECSWSRLQTERTKKTLFYKYQGSVLWLGITGFITVIEPVSPALEVWNFNHWTVREVLCISKIVVLNIYIYKIKHFIYIYIYTKHTQSTYIYIYTHIYIYIYTYIHTYIYFVYLPSGLFKESFCWFKEVGLRAIVVSPPLVASPFSLTEWLPRDLKGYHFFCILQYSVFPMGKQIKDKDIKNNYIYREIRKWPCMNREKFRRQTWEDLVYTSDWSSAQIQLILTTTMTKKKKKKKNK